MPGFRAQALAQRVEHVARVRRPDSIPSVGLVDQPSRRLKDIACLTAEVDIGGCKAYILFDSGSNTDSLTPEFAKATKCKVFKLEEQVTLQLGCVGSRSRINYGSRAPVSFGGIKGYSYFDIVNLDRYDGVIGTPFMIKHGVILDFGKREIQFPSGQVIPSLTVTGEMYSQRVTEPVVPGDRVHELRARWYEHCADLMGPIPLELPPFREVNHELKLIDDNAKYNYHMPRCPEALRPLLREKIQQYVSAGWWEMRPAAQAAPLLCIPKKDNG
ncbi:hypothetical protein B0H12DRAFT_1032092, partial [Mycena haematopus]